MLAELTDCERVGVRLARVVSAVWLDNEGRGAVHRSPAASHDADRLLVTLDPL